MPSIPSPYAYELEVCTFVNNEGEGFDIRNLVLGIKLHEGITQNFLLGEIVIADATGFLENGKLFGQESLRSRFRQPQGEGLSDIHPNEIIDQVFRIYQVGGIGRIGQSTSTITLRFSSPEFIDAHRIRVSQAYRGSMTDIAGKIAKDHLDILIDQATAKEGPKLVPYFQVREKSQDDAFHVVIPNWTVSKSINWLMTNAQGVESQSGLQDSYFFYQTANGGYNMQSLESMMNTTYLSGETFHYAPAAASRQESVNAPWDEEPAEESDSIGLGRRIMGYKIHKTANVLEGLVSGMFASKQITVDNTYKFYHERSYDYLERFYTNKTHGFPMIRQQQERVHIGEAAGEEGDVVVSPYKEYKRLTHYSDVYTMLSSDSHSVYDKDNKVTQASHNSHEGADQYRVAAKQMLKYYTMDISLPTRTDISVGQMIDLNIPMTKPGSNDVEAKFHSGLFLITDITWEIGPGGCYTTASVIKDSIINQIETTITEIVDPIEA